MPIRSSLAVALLALGITMAPAQAHEDFRLAQALASDPAKLAKHYENAQILAQLGNLWKELDDASLSQDLFQRSQQAGAAVEHPYVRNLLTGHLANELASTMNFDRALATLDEVKDTEVWIKTAWKLVGKLAKADRKDDARKLLERTEQLAQKVDDSVLRAELLSGTGAAYRYLDKQRGENLVYESFGIAQMLPDAYERALMFNEVGAHLMDIGHRELAIDVFDRVDRLVGEIKDPLHQAKALAMLGGEQAEKNERKRAFVALERGAKIAATLPEGEEKSAVLSEIARNFGQSHRFDSGIALADSIKDPYHRAEGLIRIAKNMYRVGPKDEALRLLQRTEALVSGIDDPYRRATVLRKLASEHITAGARDHARTLLGQALEAMSARS